MENNIIDEFDKKMNPFCQSLSFSKIPGLFFLCKPDGIYNIHFSSSDELKNFCNKTFKKFGLIK